MHRSRAASQRFGELLRSADGLPPRRVVQLTTFLWQRCAAREEPPQATLAAPTRRSPLRRRRMLQTLHTYVYCVREPPPPAAGTTADAVARWQLFMQLRPMLFGEHHLDEIAWQGAIDRAALADLLQAYEPWLVEVAAFEEYM